MHHLKSTHFFLFFAFSSIWRFFMPKNRLFSAFRPAFFCRNYESTDVSFYAGAFILPFFFIFDILWLSPLWPQLPCLLYPFYKNKFIHERRINAKIQRVVRLLSGRRNGHGKEICISFEGSDSTIILKIKRS